MKARGGSLDAPSQQATAEEHVEGANLLAGHTTSSTRIQSGRAGTDSSSFRFPPTQKCERDAEVPDERFSVAQVTAFPREHIGGSEFYAHQLAQRLARRGHKVSVITSNLGSWRWEREAWGTVLIERCPAPVMLWSVNPLTWALPALMRTDAAILHVHTHYFLTSVQAALAAPPLKKRVLLHLHGLDVTGLADSRKLGRLTRFRRELYDRTVTRWVVNRANALASVSRHDLDVLRDEYDVPEELLHWIPNAVDFDEFSRVAHVYPDRPVLTFIGRLEPTKGADLLPAIVSHLGGHAPDFRLDIVGDGTLRPQLESSLKEYNGNIRFLGSVMHREIPEVLARSTALLMPSRVEGVPTVALEALAAGVPVIAADVGGTREVIHNGSTGYLCRPGDVDGFAERARFLLDNQPEARRLGAAGPSMVSTDYSWSSVIPRLESVYADMMN